MVWLVLRHDPVFEEFQLACGDWFLRDRAHDVWCGLKRLEDHSLWVHLAWAGEQNWQAHCTRLFPVVGYVRYAVAA